MQQVAPAFYSSARPHPISLKQVITATAGALALFGQDTYAKPLHLRETIDFGNSPTPANPANKAQLSALANANIEPLFNVNSLSGSMKTPSNFSLYPNGNASPADVDQTVIGDCFLDSVLAAFAQQGSAVIHNMITANNDDTYTVHMYDPAGNALGVTVNNQVPEDAQNAVLGNAGPTSSANWATLAEKAYVKYNDQFHTVSQNSGYAGIAAGGDPGAVFLAFTGVPTTYAWHSQFNGERSRNDFAASLKQALTHGEPVVSATEQTTILPTGAEIIGSHAYTVMQVDQEAGRWFVDIRNPWGTTANVTGSSHSTDDGVLHITFDDYVRAMVLTYYPKAAVKGADNSNTYNPPKGQEPVNGATGGLTSGASPTVAHGLSGLGVAVLAGATLVVSHILA